MKQGLTKRQSQALKFITKFIDKNGWSPSFEEIGGGLKITAPSAYDLVERLVDRGYLKKGTSARSLRVVK